MHFCFASYVFIKLNEFHIEQVLIGLLPETSKHCILSYMASKGSLFVVYRITYSMYILLLCKIAKSLKLLTSFLPLFHYKYISDVKEM